MAAPINRRQFLTTSGLALGAAPFHALACRNDNTEQPVSSSVINTETSHDGYGPLEPVIDQTTGLPLLYLPRNFEYLTFGWTGDPLLDGTPTPSSHDGMGALSLASDRLLLIRNHELRRGVKFTDHPVYDVNAGGGTTTIEFNTATGTAGPAWASLAGTAVNCAGGLTPWNSWLTCEETVDGPGGDNDYHHAHGYIFEVPAEDTATAKPLKDMGRFVHEAVAVDPATRIVYETEDRRNSGFYRFLPTEVNNLAAGGRLEMLALTDRTQADLRGSQSPFVWQPVSWISIDDPDPVNPSENSVFSQGFTGGGATFARLEGTWYGNERIYIVSTDGGNAEAGQIWEYDPTQERLRLIYESPNIDTLNMPDNICVSPRGGLVLCEDTEPDNFIRALSIDGSISPFAKNNVVLDGQIHGFTGDFRNREFAGATFSPDGNWLFFNAQTPGITFAVTGPWADGAL